MSKKDPLYLKISENWYEKAKKTNNSKYAKFFFLWCSFNALYNLVGDYGTYDIERINELLNELSEEDVKRFFTKTKQFCDYFLLVRPPIKDMKKEFYGKKQPQEVLEFESIKERYISQENWIESIKDIMIIIYRIRNNLTHGSKEMSGDDYEIIENSIPILEVIVKLIYTRVFGERFG